MNKIKSLRFKFWLGGYGVIGPTSALYAAFMSDQLRL